MRIVFLLAGILAPGYAAALDIEHFHIEREGRVYEIRLTFVAAAAADDVVSVLTDFGDPDRLNPEVTKREVLGRQDGVTRVYTEARSCLFLFCRNITMIQDVTVAAGTILAEIVPEGSDFRSGTMRWSVTSIGPAATRVDYAATMEPAVFIPPLFGRTMIRNMLEREVLLSAEKLETEASLQTAP